MEITGPQVPNYLICADGSILRFKKLDLGAWDMDTVNAIAVATGLTLSKIVSVTGLIRNDANTFFYPFTGYGMALAAEVVDIHIGNLAGGNIAVSRRAAGLFDSAAYSGVGFSRGYILVGYID